MLKGLLKMFKEILKFLKEYEMSENNSQRLNKGYKEMYIINRIWNKLYK